MKHQSKTILLGLCSMLTIGQQATARIHEIASSDEFHQLAKQHSHVLIEFASQGCPACSAVKDLYDNLANDPAYGNVQFGRVEVAELRQLAGEHNIRGVPTFLYYRNGQEVEPKHGSGPSPRRQIGASRVSFNEVTRENLDEAFNANGQGTTPEMAMPQEEPPMVEEAMMEQPKPPSVMPERAPAPAPEQGQEGNGILSMIQNLIQSILEAIGNLLSSIVRAIKGLFGG